MNRVSTATTVPGPCGLEDHMIMLCERCCAPIDESEPVVRLAHINGARPDGSVVWIHSFLHTTACTVPRPAPHQRPDVGAWDRSRGIRGFGG